MTQNFDLGGPRQERTYHAAFFRVVRAEHGKRVAMIGLREGARHSMSSRHDVLSRGSAMTCHCLLAEYPRKQPRQTRERYREPIRAVRRFVGDLVGGFFDQKKIKQRAR